MCYVKTPGRDRNGGVLRSLPSTVWRPCPCQWNQTNDLYKKHTTLQSTRCFFYITSSYQALCSHYPLDLFILWFQMLACMFFSKKNKKTKKNVLMGENFKKVQTVNLKVEVSYRRDFISPCQFKRDRKYPFRSCPHTYKLCRYPCIQKLFYSLTHWSPITQLYYFHYFYFLPYLFNTC